jgi:hypothetical protein
VATTIYTYTLPNSLPATRSKAYQRLSSLFSHLDAFGVNVDSIVRVGLDITITLDNPLPAEQLEHLGCAAEGL